MEFSKIFFHGIFMGFFKDFFKGFFPKNFSGNWLKIDKKCCKLILKLFCVNYNMRIELRIKLTQVVTKAHHQRKDELRLKCPQNKVLDCVHLQRFSKNIKNVLEFFKKWIKISLLKALHSVWKSVKKSHFASEASNVVLCQTLIFDFLRQNSKQIFRWDFGVIFKHCARWGGQIFDKSSRE